MQKIAENKEKQRQLVHQWALEVTKDSIKQMLLINATTLTKNINKNAEAPFKSLNDSCNENQL